MSQVAKHDDMDAANTIRFEKISETTSKALYNDPHKMEQLSEERIIPK